jgi:hypothetical protein
MGPASECTFKTEEALGMGFCRVEVFISLDENFSEYSSLIACHMNSPVLSQLSF